ncbi:MAG: hypothetical protein ACOYXT_28260 [Bacteroidota bacterium]
MNWKTCTHQNLVRWHNTHIDVSLSQKATSRDRMFPLGAAYTAIISFKIGKISGRKSGGEFSPRLTVKEETL